ncbi:hypothetical protein [Variovorax sp. YR216]|uniref:hypothetical protein n=1 Tax=Variovorax sp. YR216 TaxID=1882828 RepID=UPI00089880A6|nr:hypothetical protein [Variovorax sp. YR216]SEB22649.1 hypothetical protein SAMN05444680_116114 [Variovorax sp. YR216]
MDLALRRVVCICVVGLALSLLQSCASYRNYSQLEAGPGAELRSSEVATYATNQTAAIDALREAAGEPPAPAAIANWDAIINAGMDFSDSKCEAYMHALFRLNRDRRTTVAQIGLLGGATAGVMAAAQAAAKEVAIVAIAFGLASSTVDNLSSNLLYELDPSSVRTLVKTMQETYRQELGTGYTTRPAALTAIRRYATLCVPASIEAEVNLSVKRAQPGATKGRPDEGQPPTVTNAIPVTAQGSIMPPDEAAVRLRNFLRPSGRLNPTNQKVLIEYLAKNVPNVTIAAFLNLPEFAQARTKAVSDLKLAV